MGDTRLVLTEDLYGDAEFQLDLAKQGKRSSTISSIQRIYWKQGISAADEALDTLLGRNK